jgi:uncharacterized protein (DUF488 family)
MARTIYTIGHSTRTLADFEQLLEDFGVTQLVDIRTVPRSRHVPHFNSGKLARALARKKIEYRHLKDWVVCANPRRNRSISAGAT